MRQRIKMIFLVLSAGLLFPFMIALLMLQNGFGVEEAQIDDKKRVTLSDGTSLSAETYLAGIIALQLPADYPYEMVKAQALLARTWLYRMMGEKDEVESGELGEYRWDAKRLRDVCGPDYLESYKLFYKAACDTKGETVWYEDERITPLYHALSAGQTRSDNSGACPYLVGRECNFDMEAQEYLQVQLMEPGAFWAQIGKIDPGRPLEGINMENTESIEWNTDEAGYVLSVDIGGASFSGRELQDAFGLQSSWMRADQCGSQIRVISKGIGHGYGLNQWEGKRLAESGYDYKAILEYFFQGITIKNE